ncbi:MAG: transcription elongation factor GreAB, partial [Ectopseudomonas oleovorans]
RTLLHPNCHALAHSRQKDTPLRFSGL